MPSQAEWSLVHSCSHFLSATKPFLWPSVLETRRGRQKLLGISLFRGTSQQFFVPTATKALRFVRTTLIRVAPGLSRAVS